MLNYSSKEYECGKYHVLGKDTDADTGVFIHLTNN